MVNILTGTPFDAVPRINHHEDEVALEFPPGVSSRAMFLLGLRAINWAATKGEEVETVTYNGSADITNGLMLKQWADSLGLKKTVLANLGPYEYDSPVAAILNQNGVCAGYWPRYRSFSISASTYAEASTCVVRVGTKFAVCPIQ